MVMKREMKSTDFAMASSVPSVSTGRTPFDSFGHPVLENKMIRCHANVKFYSLFRLNSTRGPPPVVAQLRPHTLPSNHPSDILRHHIKPSEIKCFSSSPFVSEELSPSPTLSLSVSSNK